MHRPVDRQAYLAAMGITSWTLRAADAGHDVAEAPSVSRHAPAPAAVDHDEALPAAPSPAASDGVPAPLAGLAVEVAACTACVLHETRRNTVFGVGNPHAKVMFIGEAPGADEDRQGEPFVGRAGQLLNAMLAAIGLRREDVFIANILKCRPPRNRDPRPEEVACCAGFLRRQIELVAPRVIVAVGRIAAQNLLSSTQTLGRLRGVLHEEPVSGTPVLVTYHPAYLLRSPAEKRKAWQDLRRLRSLLAEAP